MLVLLLSISEFFVMVFFRIYAKFHENKPLLNGEITLLLSDIGKSCLSFKFLTSQICLLRLFANIKLSVKFPNLQNIFIFYGWLIC